MRQWHQSFENPARFSCACCRSAWQENCVMSSATVERSHLKCARKRFEAFEAFAPTWFVGVAPGAECAEVQEVHMADPRRVGCAGTSALVFRFEGLVIKAATSRGVPQSPSVGALCDQLSRDFDTLTSPPCVRQFASTSARCQLAKSPDSSKFGNLCGADSSSTFIQTCRVACRSETPAGSSSASSMASSRMVRCPATLASRLQRRIFCQQSKGNSLSVMKLDVGA